MSFFRRYKAPASTSSSASTASAPPASLSLLLTSLHEGSSSASTTDPTTAASIATNDQQATKPALIAYLGKKNLADGVYLVVGDEHEPSDRWKSAVEMTCILEHTHFACYTTLKIATQFDEQIIDKPDHAESIRSGVGELQFQICPPRCSVLLD